VELRTQTFETKTFGGMLAALDSPHINPSVAINLGLNADRSYAGRCL
jgi:hypothetical protein